MDSRTQAQWASGLNVIAGIWLVISPWVLGYSAVGTPMTDAVILGFVVGVIALIRAVGVYTAPWLSWINAVLGGWLIISPWVLGFSGMLTPTWNTVILGVIVLVLGAWAAIATQAGRPAMPTTTRA